ncbi:hypothetical protein CRUP_000671 [Coryphaenoides rupestris]|nr:hypothetical protein CRUP_000671 [Coryphaenoides rupestris]
MRVLLLVLMLAADWSEAQKSEPALGVSGGGGFRGSDRYDFALVLPAASRECFWHFAHQSGNFYLDHMASVVKLQSGVFHMWRFYNAARARRGGDQHLLQTNLDYVTWWSFIQTLVILAYGPLQILFLRRLFITRQHKTRC